MEQVGTSMDRIDRKSSIEREPRTLGADQIQYAREVALYVVNTRSKRDALHIFTEGLEPVKNCRMRKEDAALMADFMDDNRCMSEEVLPRLSGPTETSSAPF